MTLGPEDDTLLIIDDIGVPRYSARGLTQRISLIDASKQQRRTINGVMDDFSADQFHKYKTTITCTDQMPPAFDGLRRGALLTIWCVAELSYKTHGGLPSRQEVSGSSYTVGDFTVYRPILEIMVTDFEPADQDEYGRNIGWSLEGEEV